MAALEKRDCLFICVNSVVLCSRERFLSVVHAIKIFVDRALLTRYFNVQFHAYFIARSVDMFLVFVARWTIFIA